VKPRLLIVDDDPSITASLSERFRGRGFEVAAAASGTEALSRAGEEPDVILLDLQLPRGDGLSVLRGLRAEGVESAVVVITAHGSIEKAVEAMREGAYDFIEKPFEPARIEEAVRRALERTVLRRENRALRAGPAGGRVVTADPRSEEVVRLARKAAATTSTVLLLGESGTGKEILARRIHEWSGRAAGPYLPVNCAALAETLLESELFGHEKGAFTGATARKPGKFEAADGGTLFLDEIGDVSLAFQAKLLRVLEERSFERVGGTRRIDVDVRVIAATHRDLESAVGEGRFRQDLYYRLNVVAIRLPPLRERRRDIAPLAEHFAAEVSRDAKRSAVTISPEAMRVLEAHSWPGNIRELRNAIERAVVFCEEGTITPADLPPDLEGAADLEEGAGFHRRVEEFRKEVIREALEAAGGNQTRAAEALGLQRTYLARLIRRYGPG
jgi:DNA-binding NtrC family response regulator